MEVYRKSFMVTLFHSYASLDVTSRTYKGHGLFTSIVNGALYLDKGEQTQANIVLEKIPWQDFTRVTIFKEFSLLLFTPFELQLYFAKIILHIIFVLQKNWKENKCYILQVKCAIFEDCEETVLLSCYILDCSIHSHPISCLPVNYSDLGTQNWNMGVQDRS